MTDELIPVNDDEVQGRVTQQDEQLERGVAILLFVDRALETWFQPQFVAFSFIIYRAKRPNR